MTRAMPAYAEKWILVPGTLCSARVFQPLMHALRVDPQRCEYLTPDLPHVEDYAPKLRGLVTGGEIVCGFSLGALILAHNIEALRSARAVILMACNPYPDPPEKRAIREADRDRILAGDAHGWVADNWSVMSDSGSAELRGFVAEMAEETAHLIPAQTELAASRPGAVDQILAADVPLIFVTGTLDRQTPASRIEGIAQRANFANLSTVEGQGHFALIEAPERVAESIQRGLVQAGVQSDTERQPHAT